VFEGDAVKEYVGGYDDWVRQRSQPAKTASGQPAQKPSPSPAASKEVNASARPKKLTYKDQRELELLPARIEVLESKIAELHAEMAAPDFYKQPGDVIAARTQVLRQLENDLAAAFARWEQLEASTGC
jgi:ATP-binding cassette subfamily F protein uup